MLKEIHNLRKEKQAIISRRLSEFRITYQKGDKEIFKELCFCILTANASAKGGIKSIKALGNLIFKGNKNQISKTLKKCGYRFWKKRADYIVETRKTMQAQCKMELKKEIEKKRKDTEALRAFFAEKAKGIGMKEASHFLRNIGFNNYAILDRHIISCLYEKRIFESNEKPKNKNQYLAMEGKMKAYSKKIKIPMNELDLILWCHKTGEILK